MPERYLDDFMWYLWKTQEIKYSCPLFEKIILFPEG